MNLFIDANIFLLFYEFTNEHIVRLKTLNTLIKKHHINLFLPKQVVDEVYRNRDYILAKTLKDFSEIKNKFNSKIQFPKICGDESEVTEIINCNEKLNSLKKKLLASINDKIKTESLNADKLISEIFISNKVTLIDDDVYNRAIKRRNLGNPPGKLNSYGDAINWEFLLDKVPTKEDLYIITKDGDFVSAININDFNNFLREEWENKKDSKIIFYRSLSEFLKNKFPDADVKEEDIQEEREVPISIFQDEKYYEEVSNTRNSTDELKRFLTSPELMRTQVYLDNLVKSLKIR